VTSREFKERLSRRARKARVQLPSEILAPYETYFRLLAQWNVKINLTGLPLQPPTDETFDRLFIEPLAASTFVTDAPGVWFDLGSGGGSPAFPLKLVRPSLGLTLVESKTRKAAFLREAIRVLKLPATDVANVRFEELDADARGADLVTVRAVRPDAALFKVAARLLKEGGRLLLFGKHSSEVPLHEFEPEALLPMGTEVTAGQLLTSYLRVFHVEQSR
jgi:16S rRNA (guanine527-N7)-methyltransferase